MNCHRSKEGKGWNLKVRFYLKGARYFTIRFANSKLSLAKVGMAERENDGSWEQLRLDHRQSSIVVVSSSSLLLGARSDVLLRALVRAELEIFVFAKKA